MNFKFSGLLLVFCLTSALAVEPDYKREARMADEIVDAILDGDAQWLHTEWRQFLSIYTEAEEVDTAVVILHGRGFHPDWADAINPLRVGLAEQGFATLSLQMPVLEKEATYYDYIPIFPYSHARIEAGIKFLREQGYNKIVLLAHSCGVHMAMSWITVAGDASIDAFIGLGMGATDYQQPMPLVFPLAEVKVPVLDLYGANEFPAVLRMAPQRKSMIEQAGNSKSRQQVLDHADHYFTDRGDALVVEVVNWLGRLK